MKAMAATVVLVGMSIGVVCGQVGIPTVPKKVEAKAPLPVPLVPVQPIQAKPKPRTPAPNHPADLGPKLDAEGEPLPTGVLARFGSLRWRHGGPIIASALSPDGKQLATASERSIAIWDLASGKITRRVTFPSADTAARRAITTGEADVLIFAADGKKVGFALASSTPRPGRCCGAGRKAPPVTRSPTRPAPRCAENLNPNPAFGTLYRITIVSGAMPCAMWFGFCC